MGPAIPPEKANLGLGFIGFRGLGFIGFIGFIWFRVYRVYRVYRVSGFGGLGVWSQRQSAGLRFHYEVYGAGG